MLDFYRVVMRTAVVEQFQYRAANYAYMIGMIAEPVIYLVVWSAVARGSGGSVRGFSPGVVRNMNIVFTPFGWEERIRTGHLSGMLLRPVHPLHYDLAYFAGWKVVVIVMWIPIAIVLSLVFRPTFDITPLEAGVFFLAIWGAYLIRSLFLWLLGMITFWTTRVSAIYELYFTAELLLSGRLVPLELMPPWVVRIANVLPFRSTFGFPIEVLAADPTPAQLGAGLLAQALWIGVGTVLVLAVWRRAVKRYSAVGN